MSNQSIPIRTFILSIFFFLLFTSSVNAQLNLTVTITGGNATSTCTDPFGLPISPLWRVEVENNGFTTYPANAFCFQSLPHEKYNNTYSCASDLPLSIEVCFRAFENDGTFCNISPECEEQICQNYIMPFPGTSVDHTLSLPNGLSSGGFVNFTIASSGNVIGGLNDFPCTATDLGVLNNGTTIGDGATSAYNNLCSTNDNEPNPSDEGGFGNDQAVWFTFTTSADPSPLIYINAYNDPSNLGDVVAPQIGIYESSTGDCNGVFTLYDQDYDNDSYDQSLSVECLEPNTTYFVIIDGAYVPGTGIGIEGYFGLEISDAAAVNAPDFICDAFDLGTIAVGGSSGTPINQSNICSGSAGEPNPQNFSGQKTVWYQILTPPSGHIIIDAVTGPPPPLGIEDINLQIAVYQSSNNTCSGFLSEITSVYNSSSYDETLELTCLDPATPFWIMIDGAGNNTTGVFGITVSDGGDIPPQAITVIDTVLCAGQSLNVGGTIYDSTGPIDELLDAWNNCDSIVTGTVTVLPALTTTLDTTVCAGETVTVGSSVFSISNTYQEVLTTIDGCDSTVTLILTVLDELTINAVLTTEATGYQDANGIGEVLAMGGDGTYTYEWSDGQTTTIATGLEGGTNVCVTVTDGNDCSVEDCILIFFPSNILSTIENDTVTCIGSTNGVLSLSVSNGAWPYTFDWENADATLNGSGTINDEGGTALIENLPAGFYSITISDSFFGISSTGAQVLDPEAILTVLDTTVCFGESIMVGTATYNLNGVINETLTSSQGCDSVVVGNLTVLQINETVLDTTICFGESITVGGNLYNTSGPINEILSAFNDCDSIVTGFVIVLDENITVNNPVVCFGEPVTVADSIYYVTGNYTNIVSAANGCDSTILTNLTVLTEIGTNIILMEASGLNVSDGQAEIIPTGGSGIYTYEWSNTQTTPIATGLTGGQTYCVTVTDDIGCTEEDCIVVLFPVNILTSIENDTLNCFDDTTGELIFSASNGQAPYEYFWENLDQAVSDNGMILTEGGTANLSNMPVGNYSLTISDIWGEAIIFAAIIAPEPIAISIISQTDASCFGICDGEVNVLISGGTPPYTYTGNEIPANYTFVNVCAMNDFIEFVYDVNNCAFPLDLITVNEPAEITISAIQDAPVSCFGGNDGEASVTFNITPSSYEWSNGETTASVNNLEVGFHTVTITNANTCQAEATILIEGPLLPLESTVNIDSEISCYDAADGMALANGIGGTTFTYLWSNGATEALATNLTVGTYQVTITDDMGCIIEDEITLTQPEQILADLTATDITCLNNSGGIINVDTTTGGLAPYTFSADGEIFTQNPYFTQLEAGLNEIFIEDANGCVESFTTTIQEPNFVTVDLGSDIEILMGEELELEALVNNSFDVVFEWMRMDSLDCLDCPVNIVDPTITTQYVVSVLDTITGCTATDRITVTVNEIAPVFVPSAFSPNFDGQNDLLKVYGSEGVRIVKSFRVYNRWGAMIFEASNFFPEDEDAAWNGRYNGKQMNMGVYVYFVEVELINGKMKTFKGDVTLVD